MILSSVSNPVDEAHGIKSTLRIHHSKALLLSLQVIILVFNPVDSLIFLIIIY